MIDRSPEVQSQLSPAAALRIASDLPGDLRIPADALPSRERSRAATGAGGARLAGLLRVVVAVRGAGG